MFINITIQMLWICYAPVTVEASQYYHVSDLNIGLLAMIFMIVYIPLAIPAAWAIDTWGFKKAVSLGAILLGVFGLLRGIFTSNFTLTLVFTIGLAIAQPFLLNAFTKLAALWFPFKRRSPLDVTIQREQHRKSKRNITPSSTRCKMQYNTRSIPPAKRNLG